jgi:hypothetical protein
LPSQIEGHFLNIISPAIVQSETFIRLFQYTHTRHARLLLDTIILLCSIIGVVTVGITGGNDSFAVEVAEILLYTVIMGEMALKVIIIGPRRVWSSEFFKYDVLLGCSIILFGSLSTRIMGNQASLSVIFR